MRSARFLLVLSVVAELCGCRNQKDDPRFIGAATAEVLHYTYFFDLSTNMATAELRLQMTDAGDCVTLPFRADLPQWVAFDAVETTRVTVDETAGWIEACDARARGWAVDQETMLVITAPVPLGTWQGLQVGYSNPPDLEGGPFYYMLSWVGQCDLHGACDNRTDRFPTYEIIVEHMPQTQVLCPGVIVSDGFRTSCTFDYDGGPTYSTFGWMASNNWVESSLGTVDGIEVKLFDFPSAGLAASFDTATVSGFLTWMGANFGAYPYGTELRLVATPSLWLGFEHPGNISLFQGLNTIQTSFDDALAHTSMHEIVHMWAGNQTTLADTYDFAWKEAIAEYLTYVYEDEQLDPVRAANTAAFWKAVSPGAQYYLVPGEQPPIHEYYGDVYGPAQMILFRQLEGWLGRPAVMTALQSVLGSESTLSVPELQDALEVASGTDLDAYFDVWVYGTGVPAWPEATISVNDLGNGDYEVSGSIASADSEARGARFTVQLTGAAGETFDVELDFGLNGGLTPPLQTVTPGFPVTGQIVDPYTQSLVREAGVGVAPAKKINPWLVPQ